MVSASTKRLAMTTTPTRSSVQVRACFRSMAPPYHGRAGGLGSVGGGRAGLRKGEGAGDRGPGEGGHAPIVVHGVEHAAAPLREGHAVGVAHGPSGEGAQRS